MTGTCPSGNWRCDSNRCLHGNVLRNSIFDCVYLSDERRCNERLFNYFDKRKKPAVLLANVNSHSRSLYVVVRPSVCSSSVCLSSVMFVHRTQTIEIFGNVSSTVAIHDLSVKILRRSSQGNPYVGGVKHKRGSRI